ncbi:MAG: PD-(D/E)XK nuclease family protein [Actinomycetota bacterium]|nr:PD-(D/E)XK nuclease family protein [Actinomycetota bacterium]
MLVLHVPAGRRGITKHLLARALPALGTTGKDFSSLYYISPSAAKCRDALGDFHQFIGINSYIPITSTTLPQLAKRLCLAAGVPMLPSHLIVPMLSAISGEGIGRSALIAGFISGMKLRFPLKTGGEIWTELEKIIYETGVPEEISGRIKDTLELMSVYDRALASKGLMDRDSALPSAVSFAGQLNIRALVIEGFHTVNPAHQILLRALIEKANAVYAALPMAGQEITGGYLEFLRSFSPEEEILPGDEPDSSSPSALAKWPPDYSTFPSREEEAEGAARRIKHLYLSGRIRDLSKIVLALPAGSSPDTFGRVLEKYGIKYSSPSGASAARRINEISSLLEAPGQQYPAAKLSAFLNSPLFSKVPEDVRSWAPKITLSGVSAGLDNLAGLEGAPAEEVKKLSRKLRPLEFQTAGGKDRASSLKAFLAALSAMGFSSASAAPDKPETQNEAGAFAEEAEARLRDLFMLDVLLPDNVSGKTESADLHAAARFVLSSIDTGQEGEGVRIMPLEDAFALEPECLILPGLRDGQAPARPQPDLILPEMLKEKIGLKTCRQQLAEEEFLIRRLVLSSAEAYLSYPEMEAEKLFLPSIIISEGKKIDGGVAGVFSEEERLVRKGGYAGAPYCQSVGEISIPFKSKHGLRVTDIDSFRACPRLFYLEKIFRLSPPELAGPGPDPRATGTLLHRLMEKLLPISISEDLAALTERAKSIIEKTFPEFRLDRYWRGLLSDTFLDAIPAIYENEAVFREDGFDFMGPEIEIRGSLAGLPLRGKADRLDARWGALGHGKTVQVLDYKTGSLAFSPSDVFKKGAYLQLFLYAALLERGNPELKVERVGIYSLKDLKVKFAPAKKDAKQNRAMPDYIDAALGFLAETAALLEAGDFRARPIDEAKCRHCHERPYCPYIHPSEAACG